MHRRTFVATSLAATVSASLAQAQVAGATVTPGADASAPAAPLATRPIEPANALEQAFVGALHDERMRPVFRRYLLDTHVALAMAAAGEDAAPREVEVRNPDGSMSQAVAIFTSDERVNTVLGEDTPRVMISGRAALERARGKNVVINFHLIPMLTLEAEDVATYLAQPGTASAGPAQ